MKALVKTLIVVIMTSIAGIATGESISIINLWDCTEVKKNYDCCQRHELC